MFMKKKIAELFDLSDKVAIVTGGAMGIGKAIAEELAKKGVQVIVCGRNPETARQTAAGRGRFPVFFKQRCRGHPPLAGTAGQCPVRRFYAGGSRAEAAVSGRDHRRSGHCFQLQRRAVPFRGALARGAPAPYGTDVF